MITELKKLIEEQFPVITIENYSAAQRVGIQFLNDTNQFTINHSVHLSSYLRRCVCENQNVFALNTAGKVVAFLKIVLEKYGDDFYLELSRDELRHMLNKLYPFYQKPFGKKMSRARQAIHLQHWINLHGTFR